MRVVNWARKNLFSSWGNSFLSLVGIWFVYAAILPVIDWAIISAVWSAEDGSACRAEGAGACWPFIGSKMGQFIYGRYPIDERWRVLATLALGVGGAMMLRPIDRRFGAGYAIALVLAYPMLAGFLLVGGAAGLVAVPTSLWGGFLITLVVSFVGIAASLPLGALLALGRRSDLPVVRVFSIGFIEFWRAVPLVIFLFMASNLLPLFLPQGASIDKLARALIVVALFSSAYMAEVVRGGLQAIPESQFEAAKALGLGYWRSMGLVILPQALRHVVPGIVNTFVGLFKDTSLVYVIGLFDLLGIVTANLTDPKWFSPQTAATGYVFVGLIYWVCCFAMSRFAARLETGRG
jgi:general L-amino acid transport system permease protein